jgi:fibronectin-binding autotransporter adhesin
MGWPGRRVGVLVGLVGLVGAPLAALVLTATPAGALTTITVTNAGDGGAVLANCPSASSCRLVDAFADANVTAGDVQINIPASLGPITLTTGNALSYTGGDALTLSGTGGNETISQKSGATKRVVTDSSNGLLSIQNLTITGGAANGSGGGIRASQGLVLTNSTITNNASAFGGGGVFAGQVTATATTFSHNHANGGSGGGIETPAPVDGTVDGSVTLTNSTVTTNTAADGGGGITAGEVAQGNDGFPHGHVTLTGSTIDHNTNSGGDGGGAQGGSLTATNSTITNNTNSSSDPGGGVSFTGSITLVYVTIASNSASIGANIAGPQVAAASVGPTSLTSFGSVVALPLGGGTDCHGTTITSHGSNWDDDGTCGFGAGPGDHSNAGDPMLGALANNDAGTLTRLPLTGSGLIDAIPVASCQADGASGITTDQRGVTRPQGAGCDIGAVEVQVAAPAPPVVITPKFTG